MKTLFEQLSWNRVFRKLRRRGHTSPIRREPGGLQLERLDDRIAPGSVFGSAAAQALVLTAPLAWLGVNAAEFEAAPALATPGVPAAADGNSAGLDWPDIAPGFFSLTSPDTPPASGSASQQLLAGLGNPSPGVVLTDLGEPGSEGPASSTNPGSAGQNNFSTSSGAGGPSGVGAPEAAGRSAGFAVSGGLPAQPAADTAQPSSPSPLRGGGGGRGSPAPAPASPVAHAPGSPKPLSAPAGHFGARLQTLLHSGDANGSFSLTDTANQQSQIGAMIGGQLTSAAGFGEPGASATGGLSTSHRPASLLGQTLADGSNKNLGLRTNQSSTGPFCLVGSQSIGDLMTSHTPSGGGLLGGADAIGQAIPEDGSPPLPAALGHAIQSPAPGTGGTVPGTAAGFVVLSAPSDVAPGSSPKGKGGPARKDPGQLPDATFRLSITPASGGSFVETGTFSIPSDWSSSSMTWLNVHVYVWDTSDNNAGEGWWSEYAYLAPGVFGFDLTALEAFNSNLDAFNAQYFSDLVNNTDPSYALTVTATTPFSVSDTSTPTEQSGTVTTALQNNYTTTGTDAFTVSLAGPAGADRVMVRDDTVNASVGGSDTGTDADSANPAVASATNDSFTNSVTGTSTEVDHTEGTIAADGTFQLTSFNIDSTSDEDFTDSVTGTTHAPEPGGSETDTFTDGDSGHDHEHLHAEGSPDNWTASFDDTASDNYTDVDNGGENSSQTTTGATDTNNDTFHADDGGTHTDVLHLGGSGDATTFTANSVNDRIEDVYDFHDSDSGTAGETNTGETDSDAYGATDNGHADEVLSISGDANSLTAGYTDGVHDGFTDTDDIHDGWSGPNAGSAGLGFVRSTGDDGGSQGTDTGSDHSTDGDNGNETVNLSADASLPNWQSDDPNAPAPTWQVTSINAGITGTSAVNAGDNGSDTETAGPDSQVETFTDGSTGTDTFATTLIGTGTAATLQQGATFNLTVGSEDDTTDRFADSAQLNGGAATDIGSEIVAITNTDNPIVTVAKTSTIDATGAITPTITSADVNDTGIVNETDDGGETIDGADEMLFASSQMSPSNAGTIVLMQGQDREVEQLHDTDHINDGVHIHADTDSSGSTTVAVDQNLNGTIGLRGSDDKVNTIVPTDEFTDDASGSLGGTVGGRLHQGGAVAGGTLTPTGSNGSFGLNVGGSCGDTNKEILDTRPSGGLPQAGFPYTPLEYVVIAGPVPTDDGGGYMPYADPAIAAHYPAFSTAPAGASLVITRSVNVPTFQLNETDADANQNWGLTDLHLNETFVNSTSTSGDYTNCLFPDNFPASGHADMSDTITTETQEDGGPGGLGGKQTRTDVTSMTTTGGTITAGGDITSGTVALTFNATDKDVVQSGEGAGGAGTDDLTEQRDVTGNSNFNYQLFWNHPGAMSGYRIDTLATSRDYHTTKTLNPTQTDENGRPVEFLTAASGTDTESEVYIFHTTIAGGMTVDLNDHHAGKESYQPGGAGGVLESFDTSGGSWTETVIGVDGGPWSNDNPAPRPPPADNRDLFAKAADFAAGMGDAVSCGLTQKLRAAGGFDDVVDKNSGWYKGGEIAGTVVAVAAGGVNPCGATKMIGGMVRTISAVQGAGQLANAAEAAKNGDPLGFALNIVGARMSFNKLGSACFAAGTPLYDTWTTAKPIEQFQVGDTILSRDENDPTGLPVLKKVEEVFVGAGRILHLHTGGQVIRTTAMHPFWVEGKGWTEAERLKPGDRLGSHDGQGVVVREVYDTGETETVYNLRIADYHTYFVGNPAWGWSAWAHNACHGNSLQSTKPTTLYQLVDRTTGQHLKFGMSSDLANRYSQAALNQSNARIVPLMTGARAQIAAIERSAVSQIKGILSNEPWAGKMLRGVP